MDASVEVTLDSLEISAPMLTILKDDDVRFRATGTYSDGTTENLNNEVVWSSSDQAVATVGPSGLAVGLSDGTTTITAELDGVSASAVLTVLPAPLRSLTVNPRMVTVRTGDTTELTAMGTLADDTQVELTDSVIWVSSDESVASVSGGIVTTVSAGQTEISVRDSATGIVSGPERSSTITVRDPEPVSLAIAPPTLTLGVNETQQLTATLTFDDDSTQDVTTEVSWTSADEDAVTVTAEGLLTTHSPGDTRVTARYEPTGFEVDLRVTITPPVVLSIEVTPASVSLELRERQVFEATAVFSDGERRPISSAVDFVSSDPSIVEISNAPGERGSARALAVGNVTISAVNPQTGMSSDDSGDSASVTVNAPTTESVIVIPRTAAIPAGLSQQFQAFTIATDNLGAEITTTAIWSSSDTNIATVDSTGLVTAVSEGTVTISATDPVSGINSDASMQSTTLTVDPPILLDISIDPPSAAMVVGSTQQFSAIASFSDGIQRNISTLVSWDVSGPQLSIDTNGLATANAVGTVTISATDSGTGISSDDSGQSATALISDAVLQSISVSPSTATLPPGANVQLLATGQYNNGASVDVTSIVVFNTSDSSVATVENVGAERGIVTAVAPGSATISATEPVSGVSSDTTSESAAITVPMGVTLSSLEVLPPSATFRINQTFPFTAQGTYSDASVHPVTTSVNWTSASSAIATVSNSPGTRGLATGVGVGATSIGATDPTTGITSAGTGGSATAIVEQGIEIADVVHYELDEGSGTTLTNSAPGGPSGTIVGPHTWNPAGMGGAPGTSTHYLTMPTGSNRVTPNLSSFAFTNLTIDFWWRFGAGTGLSYMFNSSVSFRMFTNGVANQGIYLRATPGGSDITVSTNVQDGNWHHFCYVMDASAGQGRFYIDGVQAGSTTYSGSINITSWVLMGQASTNGASADYDRFRVWSTASTPAQVTDMFMGNR